jgi:hypothetical protein
MPCDVWPEDATEVDRQVAEIVLNELRKAHSAIHTARRLHETKRSANLTNEELAQRTGLPVDRVKSYLALPGGCEDVLVFLEERDVPLKVAVEFVRYEKATNEAATRKLIERYRRSPMSCHDIAKERRERDSKRTARQDSEGSAGPTSAKPSRLAVMIEAAFRRSVEGARADLDAILGPLGYRLAGLESEGAR